MADFKQFGKAQPENQKLGFTFSFAGDELEKEPTSKYRVIPEGEHAFTVANYSFETSAKSGNNYVKVTLSVEEDDEGEVLISDNLVLTEKNRWKLAAFFSAIGMWEGPDGVKAMGVREDTWDKAIGKAGCFINGHRQYEGKTRNEVKSYVKILKSAVG